MSIYSNVTEQDLILLRKIAEQEKEQRALKMKNRILKQTHDVKLAESLSPITTKLDETIKKLGDVIKESTQNLGNVINDNNTPQLAIENTPTTQQTVENNEGKVYDVKLENPLNKMKDNSGFCNIEEKDNGVIFWNGFPIEKTGGNKLKINEKIYDITPGIRKVLTQTFNIPLKQLNDIDRENFNNI